MNSTARKNETTIKTKARMGIRAKSKSANSNGRTSDVLTGTDSIDSAGLRGYLEILVRENELVSISKPVRTEFELAAVVSKLDGKQAVLFDSVMGSNIEKKEDDRRIRKVISNLCGTRRRFYLAISANADADRSLGKSYAGEKYPIHDRVMQAIANLAEPAVFAGDPPFAQNRSTNLNALPIVTHFEKDAGPFITSSIVFAVDQEMGNQNSSTHRLLLLDERHMAIRMVEGRHLHKCYTYAKDHGQDLQVAIAIGVHPAVSIAAAYQAAYGLDEMKIACSLLGGNLAMSKAGPNSDILVPAHAEIVLEGRILNDASHEEWMVEMLRTYDFKRKQPVFELDAVRFRKGAIYYDILPGFMEHRLLMGLPVESKMLWGVKNVVPSTQSVVLTDGGCNWLHAVIQIKKRLEGEPKNALLAAFAAHPSLKMATVVDDDIDPEDPVAVEYAIATRSQADRSFIIIPNAKGSSLDPSSDQQNLLTTKVGIDATATLAKPKERFEIARIPGEEKIKLQDYIHSCKE